MLSEGQFSDLILKLQPKRIMDMSFTGCKLTSVCEIGPNDYFLCSTRNIILVRSNGDVSMEQHRLYTAIYVKEFNVFVGVSTGLPHIIVIDNVLAMTVLSNDVRLDSTFITQIEFYRNKLIIFGTKLQIFNFSVKRNTNSFHPECKISLIAEFPIIGPQCYARFCIDRQKQRIIVPTSQGFSVITFDGSVVYDNVHLTSAKVRTTAIFCKNNENEPFINPKAQRDPFSTFSVLQEDGKIKVFDQTLQLKTIYQAFGIGYIFAEYVNKEFLILVSNDDKLLLLNIKSNRSCELMELKEHPDGIKFFRNPDRIAFLFNQKVQVYQIDVPWILWTKMASTVLSIEKYYSVNNSILVGILTDDSVFSVINPDNKKLEMQTGLHDTSIVQQVVYDRGSTTEGSTVYYTRPQKVFENFDLIDERLFLIKNDQSVIQMFSDGTDFKDPTKLDVHASMMCVGKSQNEATLFFAVINKTVEIVSYNYLTLQQKCRMKMPLRNILTMYYHPKTDHFYIVFAEAILLLDTATLKILNTYNMPPDDPIYLAHFEQSYLFTAKKQDKIIIYQIENDGALEPSLEIPSMLQVTHCSMANSFFVYSLSDNTVIFGKKGQSLGQFISPFPVTSVGLIGQTNSVLVGCNKDVMILNTSKYYPQLCPPAPPPVTAKSMKMSRKMSRKISRMLSRKKMGTPNQIGDLENYGESKIAFLLEQENAANNTQFKDTSSSSDDEALLIQAVNDEFEKAKMIKMYNKKMRRKERREGFEARKRLKRLLAQILNESDQEDEERELPVYVPKPPPQPEKEEPEEILDSDTDSDSADEYLPPNWKEQSLKKQELEQAQNNATEEKEESKTKPKKNVAKTKKTKKEKDDDKPFYAEPSNPSKSNNNTVRKRVRKIYQNPRDMPINHGNANSNAPTNNNSNSTQATNKTKENDKNKNKQGKKDKNKNNKNENNLTIEVHPPEVPIDPSETSPRNINGKERKVKFSDAPTTSEPIQRTQSETDAVRSLKKKLQEEMDEELRRELEGIFQQKIHHDTDNEENNNQSPETDTTKNPQNNQNKQQDEKDKSAEAEKQNGEEDDRSKYFENKDSSVKAINSKEFISKIMSKAKMDQLKRPKSAIVQVVSLADELGLSFDFLDGFSPSYYLYHKNKKILNDTVKEEDDYVIKRGKRKRIGCMPSCGSLRRLGLNGENRGHVNTPNDQSNLVPNNNSEYEYEYDYEEDPITHERKRIRRKKGKKVGDENQNNFPVREPGTQEEEEEFRVQNKYFYTDDSVSSRFRKFHKKVPPLKPPTTKDYSDLLPGESPLFRVIHQGMNEEVPNIQFVSRSEIAKMTSIKKEPLQPLGPIFPINSYKGKQNHANGVYDLSMMKKIIKRTTNKRPRLSGIHPLGNLELACVIVKPNYRKPSRYKKQRYV